MKFTKSFTKTLQDAPKDEVAKNAQLLIRGGFIHKEMAGVYAYLPLGKQVLDRISQIVREEMNSAGGQEVQMTVLQPKDIWEKTDRWDDEKVDNWFKTKLSNGTELGIGLTHEEPIADMLRDHISSYRDLPVYPYQIQSKFRNEKRAKSGLMRGREFLMKDLYSLSRSAEEHEAFYEKITEAYHRVYERIGLGDLTLTTFADGGIFSKFSREFQTISEVGEDTIYVDEEKRIAVNKEVYTDEVLSELGLDKTKMVEKRAVEVGNIFPLGTKYADAMGAYYTDDNGEQCSIVMGSYGIGVSRLMGILVEIFSDDRGIVWPESVAPYSVHLISLHRDDGDDTHIAAQELYEELNEKGVEVLWDDRDDVRAGKKFADADLMGMPHRVVVSPKLVEQGLFEYQKRTETDSKTVSKEDLLNTVAK